VAVAIVALALGFLGLLHAFMEGVLGEPAGRAQRRAHRGERRLVALTATLGSGLLALTAAGALLPDSAFVAALARGVL
jgi:hypothetical protein